ncbi:Lar family restriction alleviation protein [Hydrogenophaga aromaticivorans]|uniref:Lar family restriction alleviation protein n=1 Tax=Hydrogenophaga aromaticivorans TaxID=2610898 RepID=UPI001B376625|nr:Lar family restriction alleviation protein [Hydrogenophaga aromaticivorans]MBQ0917504.1 Lar family restriction alleviation protein [Hydrogenophaga aromaticivorans]
MSDNLPPLLPCPFCGNKANIAMANEKHDHSGGYFIACPACDASTGLRYAMGDDPRPLLVEQWNRRAAIEADRVSRDVPAEWFALLAEARQYVYDEEGYCIEPDLACAIEDVDAMLSAAPQPQPVQAQPSGWQPISTAPDDMTEPVMVFWIDSDGAPMREFDYKEDGCWMGWHEHAEHVHVIGGHGVSYTPPYTHWMPLPSPPAEQAQKEE